MGELKKLLGVGVGSLLKLLLLKALNRILSVFTGHMLKRRIQYAILSEASHMTREHRQNAIQYLYLHLFTTKFVAILLTLTQKWHSSQISNVQKKDT